MKLVFGLLLLIAFSSIQAWNQQNPLPLQTCQAHSPYGFPSTAGVTTICRTAYLVGYDAAAKLPKFVTYTLLPQNALGCVARTNSFVADASVTGGATPADYVGTGFDKGHMAPDGDMSWDVQVEYESFLMTNMSPQAAAINRGGWKLLETSVRGWVVQLNQSFTIYAGNIYGPGDQVIGHGVVVPRNLYKIVINNQTNEVAGWIFPNSGTVGNNLVLLRATITQIQQQSGVRYSFPSSIKELQPGQEWPVNFVALTQAKKVKCGSKAVD